jgi:hypothetical protein
VHLSPFLHVPLGKKRQTPGRPGAVVVVAAAAGAVVSGVAAAGVVVVVAAAAGAAVAGVMVSARNCSIIVSPPALRAASVPILRVVSEGPPSASSGRARANSKQQTANSKQQQQVCCLLSIVCCLSSAICCLLSVADSKLATSKHQTATSKMVIVQFQIQIQIQLVGLCVKVTAVLLPLLILSGPAVPVQPPPGPSAFRASVASAAAPSVVVDLAVFHGLPLFLRLTACCGRNFRSFVVSRRRPVSATLARDVAPLLLSAALPPVIACATV